jgi:hypothetical protein
MNLDELSGDRGAIEAMRNFFQHPAFATIRIAFTNHSPKGDDHCSTSIEVAHGQNLGTRYVFNKIEELVKKGPTQPRQTPTRTPGPDPDLATS